MMIPIAVIISIIFLSFLFSQKIDILKKQVDNIYFGNFIPVHNLHQIKEKYIEIINTQKLSKDNQKFIVKYWDLYNKQYKNNEEKPVVKKINDQLYLALKSNKISDYLRSLKNIRFLIKHEVDSAASQRKIFIKKYKNMQDYLFYSQVSIATLLLIFMAIVVYYIIKQHTVLELLTKKYKIEANTDGLTKLNNRKYFDTIFTNLTQISRNNNFLSVFVMIDIDFFKQFNDTYGHDAGDIALQKVATTLGTSFNRDYEYTFRLGGEEFGIVIFDTTIDNIKLALDNLQGKIKNLNIEHSASKTSYLTISMGVVLIDETSYGLSTKQLYNNADKKLYHSKENGRDQYTI